MAFFSGPVAITGPGLCGHCCGPAYQLLNSTNISCQSWGNPMNHRPMPNRMCGMFCLWPHNHSNKNHNNNREAVYIWMFCPNWWKYIYVCDPCPFPREYVSKFHIISSEIYICSIYGAIIWTFSPYISILAVKVMLFSCIIASSIYLACRNMFRIVATSNRNECPRPIDPSAK